LAGGASGDAAVATFCAGFADLVDQGASPRCFSRLRRIALFDLGAASIGMMEDDAFEDVEQLLRLRIAVDKGDKQFFVEPEV
jgi:hypothetical protein